jgi:hypothetical protein
MNNITRKNIPCSNLDYQFSTYENCGNGRISIPQPDMNAQFQMFDKIDVQKSVSFRDSLVGNWKETELSCAFFSAENVRNVNNLIIQAIQQKTNGAYNIGMQDQDELQIIMRSIYLENSKNLPNNIPEQINALNQLVLQYAVPQIYSSLTSYAKYMHDITNVYTIMDRPIFGNSNDRTVEFKGWFVNNH